MKHHHATHSLSQGTQIEYTGYVGMVVHKDTIAVAIALPGRTQTLYRCVIRNTLNAVNNLLHKLSEEFDRQLLLFGHEAGPFGNGLYRQLIGLGHDCQIDAPSLMLKKAR